MEWNKYNYEQLSSIKYCRECKHNKPLEDYDINRLGQFGRYPMCKMCRSNIRKLINNEPNTTGLKTCSKCKIEKEKFSYSKDKSKIDGLQIYCRICRRDSTKKWSSSLEGFIKKILSDLKIYCKNKNIYNDLVFVDIKQIYDEQNGLCALTGLPLTFIAYSNENNNEISEFLNISIDRIDSLNGFTVNNIQLIGSMIKRMKGTMSNDKFIEYCKMVIY
jgi:hypothetical protein